MADTNSVFISYRREVGDLWALALFQGLTSGRIDAVDDIESMTGSGAFDTALYNQIAVRPDFLLVLTPGSLDRGANPGDWLRREIHRAHESPHGDPTVHRDVPMGRRRRLPRHPRRSARRVAQSSQGVQLNTAWFKEGVAKLVHMLAPVSATALPAPTAEDHERARRAALQADRAAAVTDSQLVAEVRTERQTIGQRPSPPPPPPPTPPPPGRRWWLIAVVAAAAVVVVLVAVLLLRPSGDDVRHQLDPGDSVDADHSIQSADGSLTLEVTPSGRLVARRDGVEFWSPPRAPDVPGAQAVMQPDGNFVLYRPGPHVDTNALFATVTQRWPGSHLELVVVDGQPLVVVKDPSGNIRFRAPGQVSGGGQTTPSTSDATQTTSSSDTTATTEPTTPSEPTTSIP